MSKTDLFAFRRFVLARDYQGIARGYRAFRKAGYSTREICRIALASDPALKSPEWDDIVKTALEKHPEGGV